MHIGPVCFVYCVLVFVEYIFKYVYIHIYISCRSRWACGLRHELSALAQKLGPWVPIPLKVWMSVCAFILYLCVGSGLATG
jgi:hypothetical protein